MLETILADVQRNMRAAAERPLLDTTDVNKHLQETVWPFLEAMVEAVAEQLETQGEAIDEIVEGSEDLLHAETAQMIVGALGEGLELLKALAAHTKFANDKSPAAMALKGRIAQYGGNVQEVIAAVVDVTIPDDDEEDEPDDGSESEDDADAEDDDDGEEDDHVAGQ